MAGGKIPSEVIQVLPLPCLPNWLNQALGETVLGDISWSYLPWLLQAVCSRAPPLGLASTWPDMCLKFYLGQNLALKISAHTKYFGLWDARIILKELIPVPVWEINQDKPHQGGSLTPTNPISGLLAKPFVQLLSPIGSWSHLEAIVHCFAKPDVFLLLGVLAGVPILWFHSGLSWVDTSLSSLHVTIDLDGIQVTSLVGVNPVFTWRGRIIKKLLMKNESWTWMEQ